jgi:membrane AbrB-like protein
VLRRVRERQAARILLTLLITAAGGLLAQAAGIPAGWMAGGLIAVVVASLAGVNTAFPRQLNAPVFLLLGIYAGTGVSEETLRQMRTWPGSFLLLVVGIAAATLGSAWWLRRRGWDRSAALLASLPGALSIVIAVAEGLKTDVKKVVTAQMLRLIVLVEVIPLIGLLVGHPADSTRSAALPVAGFGDMALLLAAGLAVALLFERLRVPGGWVVGGLVGSAALLLGGVVEARLPNALIVCGTIALCALTGCRFRPGDLPAVMRVAGPVLVSIAIACTASAAAAAAVSLIFGISIVQTLIAFAPGALDALIIMAFQMNIDPAYVAAHHVARFVALAFAVPFLARWLARQP